MKGKVPGFADLDVPGPNELRPSPKDADPGRGKLAFLPSGIRTVHDYGAAPVPYESLYPDSHRPTLSATSSATASRPDEDGAGRAQPTTTPSKIR